MYLLHTRWIFRCLSRYVLIVSPPTYMDPWIHEYFFLFHVNGTGTLAFVVISNAPGVHGLYCISQYITI